MQHSVCTTNHVTSTTVQCETFHDSSRQLNPPNDEKVEDQKSEDSDQDEAFERVCVFLEENDEKQLTISNLVAKMGEYLRDSKSTACGNQ